MSVLFADRGHLQRDDDGEARAAAARISDAIHDLPAEDQERVEAEFYRMLADYQATRRIDPVVHYIESLLATARLHRNPHYLKALAESTEHTKPKRGALDHEGLAARFQEFLNRQ